MNAEQAEEPPKKVPRIEQITPKINRDDEQISVPNWLIEVLAWIERIEMANSALSTSSWIFKRLCGPKLHGDVQPCAVGPIKLVAEQEAVSRNLRAIALYGRQLLQIPSTSPPHYIIGFKWIHICFLDDRVLEFIKCISTKLDGIKFVMKMNYGGSKWKVRDERTRAFQCLLNALAGRISHFHFSHGSNFKTFNLHFRHFIDHCQCISIDNGVKLKKPEFNVLFEWLTNRRQMDLMKQKVLKLSSDFKEVNYFFGRIKEEFSKATEPLNFLVCSVVRSATLLKDLYLENKNTGEMLISYWSTQFYGYFILRCPKGQEDQLKKEGEQKMKMFYLKDMTTVLLEIEHFGTFADLA